MQVSSDNSERIISSVAQMTAKWIENKNIEHIVKEPRIHVSNKKVYFENKKDSTIIHEEVLKSFNFKIKTPSEKLVIEKGKNAYYGGIHVIAKENGEWVGVADPRRDGVSIIAKKQLNE